MYRTIVRAYVTGCVCSMFLGCGAQVIGEGLPKQEGQDPFPGAVSFVKHDAHPELPNPLGVQAVVYPLASQGPFVEYHEPSLLREGGGYGLFYEYDVLGYGRIEKITSPDGVTWNLEDPEEVLTASSEGWEHRDVGSPSAVMVPGETRVRVYYEGGRGAGIGLAFWSGEGGAEKFPDPVLLPTESWERGSVGSPHVLYDAARRYGYHFVMWYQGAEGKGIGMAVSHNGIEWEKADGNTLTADSIDPILTPGPEGTWDSEFLGHPAALIEDTEAGRSIIRLWYTGESDGNASIGHAGSFDGATWTKAYYNPVLDEAALGLRISEREPFVLKQGKSYCLWFTQGDLLPPLQGIALATRP